MMALGENIDRVNTCAFRNGCKLFRIKFSREVWNIASVVKVEMYVS